MAEIQKAADWDLPLERRDEIRTTAYQASAFAKAATGGDFTNASKISGTGEVVFYWDPALPEQVTEGGKKPVVEGGLDRLEVLPAEYASIKIITDDLAEDFPQSENTIFKTMPNKYGLALDRDVMATDTNGRISGLGGATEIELSTPQDFTKAMGEVSAEGFEPSAVVMTTTQFYRLAGLRYTQGAAVFPGLQGTREDANISGLPVYVFQSVADVGFIGSFADTSFYGTVGTYPEVKKIFGAVTLENGTIYTLEEHDSFALRGKTRVAFRVLDTKHYRKLVAPAVTPGDEDETGL